MIITVITSNHPRHLYLIKKMSEVANKLFVIIEPKSNLIEKKIKKNKILHEYFKKVQKAENQLFPEKVIKNLKNTTIYPVSRNKIDFETLKNEKLFLKSSKYIVFGSSIIKDKLYNYLKKKGAINIHMGISPYYRGTDCNFWAIIDKRPQDVGGTIMQLSKKIDAGKILFTSKVSYKKNKFDFMMSSCRRIIDDLKKYLKDNKKKMLFKKNNLKDCVRFSKKKDFNSMIIKKFYKINIKKANLDK
jgi:methionyl-tRNA formyltransferase|tara:strand:+ start:204 stop:938 length:735 start_codon:yes stop_codon:yes gene_type:complete